MRMVRIVGHRGAAGYEPENTIASFQKAIALGCDRTELDVRVSKDKQLIVFHDEDVSRVTESKGLVRELLFKELHQLRVYKDGKIPLLKQVVALCRDNIDLQIELKVAGTARGVNDIITYADVCDSVVISSFDGSLLREMNAVNPRLKLCLLCKPHDKDWLGSIERSTVDMVGLKGGVITVNDVVKAHDAGKKVYAYHVGSGALGKKLIRFGVDDIGTDFPKLFLSD